MNSLAESRQETWFRDPVKTFLRPFPVRNLLKFGKSPALMKLVFASNNPHKLEEVRATLGPAYEIISLASLDCRDEIPETQDTLQGNALQKARAIFDKFGRDCFADDTGLEIDALGGQPGVFTARFAGVGCPPADNRAKTLKLMAGMENRKATFRTVIALILGGREYVFEGCVSGLITTEEKGVGGFGYDPIFQPDGFAETYAELDLATKSRLSHRARATLQLKDFLEKRLSAEVQP